MQPDLAAGIVRILHADGSTAGTGFVVSARGLIATCSHVVQSEQSQRDGEPRPERVSVVFHATGEQRDAIVEPAWWRPHDSDDVAILRLDGPLPAGVVPIRLGFTRHCNGHKLQTLGFPELPGGYETAWAEGEIRGVVPHPGKRPMLQLDAKPIRQGMSGAPVLDLNTKRVIGMVSEYAPSAPLEWATTSETLKEVCPELELHLPQAVEDYLTALGQFCRDLPYVSLERDVPLTTVYVRQQMRRKPDEKRQPDDERAQLEALERRARPMPIEEALAQHARLLVVGGPGAGKSTLLRHLVEEQLVEEDDARDGARFTLRSPTAHLTILVSLRGLAGREGDATTCLRQQIEAELGKRLPARLPDDFLKEWAEQTGAAWLIALDGLDEILDADRRRALLKELAQTAWPPGSRIVLTSRPDESLSTGGAVTPFDLLPFEPAQVEAFAHNWFKDEALVDAFLRNVQHPTLRAVTSIPLLLTVAAIVFEDEAKKQTATDVGVLAPESHRGLADIRRVTLYERFVTILLKEDRTANRRMKEQFCEQFRTDLGETLFDYRREALECVALAMQEARYVEAALIEFLGRLPRWSDADARRKAGDVLNILVQQRTGLVVQRGATYDFIHPTFREYLAAAAIVRACENDRECVWQRAISHWQNERWREVPLLALGILSEEGTDVTHLLERIPWRREQGALYFVGAALSEKVQVSPNFADGVIGSLLDAARRMDWLDRRQRPNALTVLAELRAYPLAGDGLLSLARDERVDADIRQATAEALGTLGRADDLLALARDERVDAGVRTAAAESLGKLGRADEAAPILLALAHDERVDAWVRWTAAEALGELGRADEAALILLALARDERVDTWVLEVAALALGKLLRADDLLALARDERVYATVRMKAVMVLDELGRADDLLALARDAPLVPWVRRQAAEALGELGRADEAAPILLALVRDEREDVWGRVDAAEALGKMDRPDDLLALARDERVDESVRCVASEVLGELGRADEAAPILLALVRDERVDVWVRRQAAEALGTLGRADDLLALARDERVDAGVRTAAAESLGKLGRADEAAPILLSLARDKRVDAWVRRQAAEALGKLGRADGAAPILLALVRDEHVDAGVRTAAAEALGKLDRADEAVQARLTLARDVRLGAWQRREAAKALGELGRADEATQAWLALARDERVDAWVRVDAAEALGKLGRADEAAPILLALVRDERVDASWRKAAAEALGTLGRADEAAPILLALARDEHVAAGVRRQAAEALGKLGRADEAAPILLALARDKRVDAQLRWQAIEALGKLGRADDLLALARDERVAEWVCTEAAEALGKLGRADDLLALARDEHVDVWVRLTAAEALGKLDRAGDLLALVRDERMDPDVRRTAVEALGKLGRADEAAPILLALARDERVPAGVRWAAKEAIREINKRTGE